jgi:ElaB/YqjD/DUF883 family membrane-anchored ribosome-binding protein
LFNPLTGQFDRRTVATLDPSVYKEIKDGTKEVADEASFIRSHVAKDKQHLREIKARLRALEEAQIRPALVQEQLNPAPTAEVIELATALELDLLHNLVDEQIKKLDQSLVDIYDRLNDLETKAKQVKPSNLVQVKIDQEIDEKFNSLKVRSEALDTKVNTYSSTVADAEERVTKYVKTSIWISVGTTLIIIALRFI